MSVCGFFGYKKKDHFAAPFNEVPACAALAFPQFQHKVIGSFPFTLFVDKVHIPNCFIQMYSSNLL